MSNPCQTLGEWRQRLSEIKRRTFKLWDLPKPTIAMVHGYCLAGAMEMVLACDLTIASEEAQFGEPEIRHGSMAQLFLPFYLGPKKAREIIFTGDLLSAAELERLGLVNHVVAADQLEAAAYALARKLAKVPPEALRLNKRAMNKAMELQGLRESADYTDEVSTILHTMMMEFESAEGAKLQQIKAEQGMKAFLQARAAAFEE